MALEGCGFGISSEMDGEGKRNQQVLLGLVLKEIVPFSRRGCDLGRTPQFCFEQTKFDMQSYLSP